MNKNNSNEDLERIYDNLYDKAIIINTPSDGKYKEFNFKRNKCKIVKNNVVNDTMSKDINTDVDIDLQGLTHDERVSSLKQLGKLTNETGKAIVTATQK